MKLTLFGRTHFSSGESLLSPKALAAAAKAAGYESAALADTMSISALIPFTKACEEAGVRPIVGARVRVVEDPTYRKPPARSGEIEKPNPECFFDLYIVNAQGFEDLTRLLSRAHERDFFYYVPRVGLPELCDALRKGNLACVTSDAFSVFHLQDYQRYISMIFDALMSCPSDLVTPQSHLFMRVESIQTPLYDTLNARALSMAVAHGLPLLASYGARYETPMLADAKDVYATIVSNDRMDSPWRRIPFTRDHAPLAAHDLAKRTIATLERCGDPDAKRSAAQALRGNESLASLIKYTWVAPQITLPEMAADEYGELRKLCVAGFKARFAKPVLGHMPDAAEQKTYAARLQYELGVLRDMNFAGYFLLVRDLVVWAKDEGIIVGPGRGSVGGSLVAYLIGITDVDPLRFGLLFERFINPERLDLPDADLDFMSTRRQEVITYLVGKYGSENVTGISNYTTMASSSALRNVGRVYGLDNIDLTASKLIPKEGGTPYKLERAADEIAEVERFRDSHPLIWKHACALEGQLRSMGRHAAGVAVAGEPIVKRGVIERRGDDYCVNWDKRTAEDMGLVKLDVLGLSTLDVLSRALDLVERRHGKRLDLLDMPLDDPKVMSAFGQGATTGVFQFESPGMRKLLRDLAVAGDLTFDDLSAATALYRPGPMESGLMADYVSFRQSYGEPIFEHPSMKAGLEETGGVIVYQEQVMQVARDLAGYSMADADFLRKAMGKKLPAEMAKQREQFVAGATAGWVSVELEDGQTVRVHRARKFKCADGLRRTVEEALRDVADIDGKELLGG